MTMELAEQRMQQRHSKMRRTDTCLLLPAEKATGGLESLLLLLLQAVKQQLTLLPSTPPVDPWYMLPLQVLICLP